MYILFSLSIKFFFSKVNLVFAAQIRIFGRNTLTQAPKNTINIIMILQNGKKIHSFICSNYSVLIFKKFISYEILNN